MVAESSILRRMENIAKKPRTQLDRDAWVAGATEVLAEEGIAGLRGMRPEEVAEVTTRNATEVLRWPSPLGA